MKDQALEKLIKQETKRQRETLAMIPSENMASKEVKAALGSPFTDKYAEGEPRKRYYQGNKYVDEVELLACKRALKLFKLNPNQWHVNVKAISAGIANFAVLTALLEPHSPHKQGSKIMSMFLPDGGHLSHGWRIGKKPIHFSSKIFRVVQYRVDQKTKVFDYKNVARIAKKEKPDIIISGGTAYPREIDYRAMGKIAKSVGALYMADIAHEAGLVAAGVNVSPFRYADVVTMSTQKTLRGPRGAIIFCRKELQEKIDRAIFPGLQGGPFVNNIAAIAVALHEASTSSFKKYAKQVVKNAKVLAAELPKYGFDIVSGGTDKHLVLIDLRNKSMNGSEVATILEKVGIVANKNTVPYETGTPFNPSGLRLGTPSLTTRGMKEKEMIQVAQLIYDALHKKPGTKNKVLKLCRRFPAKRFL